MGPYPNVYAYELLHSGIAKLEFNTEAGPTGEQIPPIETMRMMMPEKDSLANERLMGSASA